MPGAGGGSAPIPARAAAGALAAAYGWWAVSLTPFSAGATAAVVGAGAAAVVLGSLRTPPPRRPVGGRRLAPWAVLGAALAAWQMAAYAEHPRRDHPTLSSLTNELLDSRTGRAAAFVVWLAAAAQLGRR